MYKFSKNWFEHSELKQKLLTFINPNNKLSLLEIGAYEGACSCFLSDYVLLHDLSTLICIDPFDTTDSTSPVYNTIRDIFVKNIIQSKNCNKVTLVQDYSTNFFKFNTKVFDFIYIDGSHMVDILTEDLNNSLLFIKKNGIIWIDDYLGGENYELKKCIDSFYNLHKSDLEIIHTGYQIAFKRS